ncbi:transporter [Sphingomonas jeddahensis]|uniref:MetA-pathway of phenol degradation n=1 Tax=Sphingomonas jeddahensis TaxID=1915074 RepID=A0A1V2EVY7_9SPHN|nr:transporter [Sphingomonas jeddahensis]ONF96842.1 hypothetical protein SPHI_10360 [Sphingomonas jeddahensis]
MTFRNSVARIGTAAALALGSVAMPTIARAQAIDAGDYVPAPAGTQLALVYLQYSHAGALYRDGRKIDEEAELDTAVALLRYVRFSKVGGMTFNYQVLQPFGYVAGGGSTASLGKTTGFGDTILVGTLWLREDADSQSYFGVTPYLYIPTGDYRSSRGLNLGENRWKGSLQAVYSKGFGKHFIAELSGDVMIYGKNDDAGAASNDLTQKATVRLQGFLRFPLGDRNELNARVMHVTGGETRINGIRQDDVTRTTSLLGTWRHNITPKWQILTQVGADVAVRNGFKEGVRGQIRLLRVF